MVPNESLYKDQRKWLLASAIVVALPKICDSLLLSSNIQNITVYAK